MAVPPLPPGPPRAAAGAAPTSPSRSRRPSTSTARRDRLGRAKPRTIWGVSGGRPRRARISSRTIGGGGAGPARTRAPRGAPAHAPDREVLRTEVVPPLADAVGLVDRHQRDVQIAEHRPESRKGQALGGHIDEAVPARGEAGQRRP